MGRDFRGDVHTSISRLTNGRNGTSGRNMCNVKMRTRQLREHQIACNENIFSDGRVARQSEPRRNRAFVDDAIANEVAVFSVRNHGCSNEPRVLEDAAHYAAIHDRLAVVAESHGARFDKCAHFCHHGAFETVGRSRDGIDTGR